MGPYVHHQQKIKYLGPADSWPSSNARGQKGKRAKASGTSVPGFLHIASGLEKWAFAIWTVTPTRCSAIATESELSNICMIN
ncbi:MAG: hypothetical protein Q9213_000865 [Squamulea squamosa]